mmetsp:Transcript_21860/g.47537  ORF Transcript_21860/g.47537 Transcript_21860/m.47537 type:complete len:204 (+) Transcript_21860:50-661(+)
MVTGFYRGCVDLRDICAGRQTSTRKSSAAPRQGATSTPLPRGKAGAAAASPAETLNAAGSLYCTLRRWLRKPRSSLLSPTDTRTSRGRWRSSFSWRSRASNDATKLDGVVRALATTRTPTVSSTCPASTPPRASAPSRAPSPSTAPATTAPWTPAPCSTASSCATLQSATSLCLAGRASPGCVLTSIWPLRGQRARFHAGRRW